MSCRVHITDEADRDLRSIFEYIAFKLGSMENAIGQLSRLEKEIYALCELPERYRLYELEPWRSLGTRLFPVDNYCVFYLTNQEKDVVDVIRVLYAGRDIDSIMSDFAGQ